MPELTFSAKSILKETISLPIVITVIFTAKQTGYSNKWLKLGEKMDKELVNNVFLMNPTGNELGQASQDIPNQSSTVLLTDDSFLLTNNTQDTPNLEAITVNDVSERLLTEGRNVEVIVENNEKKPGEKVRERKRKVESSKFNKKMSKSLEAKRSSTKKQPGILASKNVPRSKSARSKIAVFKYQLKKALDNKTKKLRGHKSLTAKETALRKQRGRYYQVN
ncbi:hypothetical protein TNCT_570161 [Trichonephila clavata]|uniref:Uncharacterized protein n=1 Tax=Trichonephila clavata TaxID=2740835 RepID=A0A8X6LJQ9_TRICU|nr:hypothetical protein TNCT_570161 [Trichonephila clavata]